MITLLYVNVAVFSFIGVVFCLTGSNINSLMFGMVGLTCAVANGLLIAGVLK